jgi:hypothetical protein
MGGGELWGKEYLSSRGVDEVCVGLHRRVLVFALLPFSYGS